MRKDLSILLLIVLIALAIRLYPTAISGMPYSTDAWPLIRNTNLLIENTPVPLNSGIFDVYNNFWAASQIYSAILSQITGLEPITAMSWGIPIAAALAIPLFYLLAKKITANKETSLIAALLLAIAFPYTFFTAGVTKEAFASPIYISLILLFLYKHDKKSAFLFLIASTALAFTHHLTAFFATITILAISIGFFFSKNQNNKESNSNSSNLLFAAIQVAITMLYLIFFASPTFSSNMTYSTILTVFLYQILAVALSAWLVLSAKKGLTKRSFPKFILFLLGSAALMLMIVNTSTLSGAHVLYAVILIIGLPAAVFGLTKLHQRGTRLTIPLFWLMAIIGFICFTLFANVAGAPTFTWRSINFLLPPLLILVAVGTYHLVSSPKSLKTRRLTKGIAALLILAMVAVNVNAMYQSVSIQNPSFGYSWLYYPSDLKAADWVAKNTANQTVAGDIQVKYLLGDYFDKPVSVSAGLRYLQGDGSAPEILYIYNQMTEAGKGYVIEGVPYSLPANWTDKLSNYNLVYANSEVTIYAKQ